MGRKKAGIFQFDNSPVFGFRRQDIYSRKIALIRLFIDSGSFPACRRSCSEKKIRGNSPPVYPPARHGICCPCKG